jgi:hypothetical protein
MIAEHPEEIPDDNEDLQLRIQNLIDQVDNNISVLSENFEDVVIITRKIWKESSGVIRNQIIYRYNSDPLVVKSCCDLVSRDLSYILEADVLGDNVIDD